ncbi:unnamed protein product [Acanthoscelides obtectus]|uniref:Mutator-like transposase domain-containing protein n=1 Tax=Acanthoscelides obtectus TaxID=200917 RepID=A0A9P0VQF6_ACAOB|nr:unnamed protein product [Acanthoscelides obtectus]CAK1682892.1 hypothetical protein AOBTE_LOCUS33967 [Acanthoscelides obtectus]
MVIESEPPCTTKKSVNTAAVWGSISTGIGHSQHEELMGVLNVPAMTFRTFRKKTSTVKKVWEEILNDDMKAAGIEEKRVAIEKGNLMPDDTPYITVIVDGGWSKRTYGHGYDASSGVAVIIGAETKKPLFLGDCFTTKRIFHQNHMNVLRTLVDHRQLWSKTS